MLVVVLLALRAVDARLEPLELELEGAEPALRFDDPLVLLLPEQLGRAAPVCLTMPDLFLEPGMAIPEERRDRKSVV